MADENQITRAAVALRSAGTLAAIAARIGVSIRAVSAWRSGAKLPSVSHQVALESAYAVARADWYLLAERASATIVEPTAPASLSDQLHRVREALCRPDLTPEARHELRQLEAALNVAIVDVARAARRSKTTAGATARIVY